MNFIPSQGPESGTPTDRSKTPIIIMRKNSGSDLSRKGTIVILETSDKKITFNLKNDKEFLDKYNIDNNLNVMRSSMLNPLKDDLIKSDLEKSVDNVNIQNKIITNISVMDIQVKKTDNIELNHSDRIINIIPDNLNKDDHNLLAYPIKLSSARESEQLFDLNYIQANNKDTERENNNSDRDKSDEAAVVDVINKIENNNELNEQLIRKDCNIVTEIINKNAKDSNSTNQKSMLLIISKRSSIMSLLPHKEEKKIESENLKSDSSEIPFRICFICDQFFLKDKINYATDCEHSFCRRCGKGFYEEKIEQGDVSFKCPVYKCEKKVSLDIIINLVSEKHFKSISSKEEKMNSTKGVNNFIKMDSVKYYTQKHVLDINTNETFFIYNKAKENFCIKCSEAALYGKSGKYIVKCLNCYHTICKFCMKSFTADHFEISSFNYCKVYFRRRLRKGYVKEKQLCKNFLFLFLIYIASYLLICLSIYKIIYVFLSKALGMCFSNNINKSSVIKNILCHLMLILTYSIITPLFLLCIPYFPPLITMLHFLTENDMIKRKIN